MKASAPSALHRCPHPALQTPWGLNFVPASSDSLLRILIQFLEEAHLLRSIPREHLWRCLWNRSKVWQRVPCWPRTLGGLSLKDSLYNIALEILPSFISLTHNNPFTHLAFYISCGNSSFSLFLTVHFAPVKSLHRCYTRQTSFATYTIRRISSWLEILKMLMLSFPFLYTALLFLIIFTTIFLVSCSSSSSSCCLPFLYITLYSSSVLYQQCPEHWKSACNKDFTMLEFIVRNFECKTPKVMFPSFLQFDGKVSSAAFSRLITRTKILAYSDDLSRWNHRREIISIEKD